MRLDSHLYELLGFRKSRVDQYEDLVKDYDSIPDDKKQSYFEIELERRFGITLEQLSETYGNQTINTGTNSFEEEFEFPTGTVKNWEALKKHAVQILSYASPTVYEQVVRRIRVSRPRDDIRAYLMNMYRVSDRYRYACQLCHKPFSNIEACQIENKPDLELEPLNLCLCPTCAQRFKMFRNDSYNAWKLLKEISSITEEDISGSDYVSVRVKEFDFWFTQIHIAEIIELLKLKKEADDTKKAEKASGTINIQYGSKKKSQVAKPVEKRVTEAGHKQEEKKSEPEEMSDAERMYRQYVGHTVFHMQKERYAKVMACDAKYITLRFEDGPDAGKDTKFVLEMCLDNQWLVIMD